ncbi:MAG TPA: alpha/beta fold hydrolase, partial [Gemmatimonadaceae bacterium]|nr:alpha/beta fold hydrolase [Gemmatimonadaceae bacterium]
MKISRLALLVASILLAPPLIAQDQYFDSDGVRIRYVVEGAGGPVVLVHGFAGRLEAWRTHGILENLARDHRVIAFDMRGHGKSAKPRDPKADGLRPGMEALKKLRPDMRLVIVDGATHAGERGILDRPELIAALRQFLDTRPQPDQGTLLFIQHVAVVDVSVGRVLPDMSVEIRGRTIAAVARDLRVPSTGDATVVDGRGKYLIPGLWDMHVHLSFPEGAAKTFLPVMVANGILGARDMHSFLSAIVAIKREVASGAQIGPRLFIAGPAVDGPNSYLPAARVVHTPDEARTAVRELKAAGVDFIKVYSSLPRDLYLAVAGEAKSEDIPFVGHVPYPVTAREAS